MDLFGRLIFKKPSIGLGDAFIGMAIGGFLGLYPALLAFMLAIILGGIIGGGLHIFGALKKTKSPEKMKGKNEKSEEEPEGIYMPFGPFLALSAVIISYNPPFFVNAFKTFWHWWVYSNPFM